MGFVWISSFFNRVICKMPAKICIQSQIHVYHASQTIECSLGDPVLRVGSTRL
jgi:hypothetical protein